MSWTDKQGAILPVKHLLPGDLPLRAYRAVTGQSTSPQDFLSHYERDMPARGIERRSAPIWQAVSMFTTRQALESRIAKFPAIGTAIAEIELLPGHGIAVAETIGAGHLSIWADPQILDSAVKTIYTV